MAIRPICITGNPVLHTRASEVVDFDAELDQLVQDMFETMDAAPGVGLAAPQIGVGKRVFTYNYTEDDGTHKRGVVINPVLEVGPVSEEMPDDEEESEGCLSFPGYRFGLKRANTAVITGVDLDQNPVKLEAEGWFARIFQHEYDHLNGILYVDRLIDEYKPEVEAIIDAEEWGQNGITWMPGVDDLDA